MPAYNASLTVALYPGDSKQVFANEAITAGEASLAVARHAFPGGTANATFVGQFAASATAVINIQGAMEDEEGAYYTVGQLNFGGTTAPQVYPDAGNSIFYRFQVLSYSGGGNFTATVRM